jgi:signal transduction histidine kinase
MIIAIIILSIITLGLCLLIASSFYHIRALKKELKNSSYLQLKQQKEIADLVNHIQEVTYAVNDISDYLFKEVQSKSSVIPYFGTIGKA